MGGIVLAINRKRFVTRSEYAEENKRLTKINKLSKHLNVYILVVAVLTVAVLALTITMGGTREETAPAKPVEQEKPATVEQPEEPVDELSAEELPIEKGSEPTSIIVTDDPVVQEVRTHEAWPVHPTEQTGPHTSTFENGHIDYEEKLAAIFSVIDLVREDSIIKSVRNNGSASNAIAVISSMDGLKMYRVSIEWVDGMGWKPVKLEVLKTLDGAY